MEKNEDSASDEQRKTKQIDLAPVLTSYSSRWPTDELKTTDKLFPAEGTSEPIPIPDGVYSGGTGDAPFIIVHDDSVNDGLAAQVPPSEEERWLEAIIYPICHLVEVSYKGRKGFGPEKLALAEKLAADICGNPETSVPPINESAIKRSIIKAVGLYNSMSNPAASY